MKQLRRGVNFLAHTMGADLLDDAVVEEGGADHRSIHGEVHALEQILEVRVESQ